MGEIHSESILQCVWTFIEEALKDALCRKNQKKLIRPDKLVSPGQEGPQVDQRLSSI